MFSQAEIDFLQGRRTVSEDYRYVLTHRILKKLTRFERTIMPALMHNDRTRSWLLSLGQTLNHLTENGKELTESSRVSSGLGNDRYSDPYYERGAGGGIRTHGTSKRSRVSNPSPSAAWLPQLPNASL